MIQLSSPYLLLAVLPLAGALVLLSLRRKRCPILRGVTLLLVVLALAGPRVADQKPEHNVVFLVDRSASVTLTSSDELARMAMQRIVSEHPDSTFASIEFARTATLAVPLGSSFYPVGVASLDTTASSLDAAVTLALSILPEGGAKQLVLLSDGQFTDDVEVALGAAQQAGVPISVVPIGSPPTADVVLASMGGPSRVSVGRTFSIDIDVEASRPVDATIVVYRDQELISFERLFLGGGRTTLSIQDRFDEPVARTYQAIVKATDDPIPDNDARSLLVSATEQPPVLLVDPLGASAVPDLLQSLGLDFTRAEAIPSLEVLAAYRQVILTGLSFATLTVAELDAIGGFVRNLGGGLLVVEGEEEVRGTGNGGIEELLPVSYTLPEKSREAQLALVYVLDRSSSMRSRVGGVEKIEILKEAAAASAALLDATTHVGILAFNLDHEWIVPISPVESSTIYYALRQLEAIGGTDVYYPIVEALDRLAETDVPAKHILLISDGKTVDESRNYAGLIRRLQELDDVTLSAIGVGRTMNVALLSALAEAGSGTLYRADDFSLLPQVSIQATQRISRQRFVDGPVDVAGRLRDQLGSSDIPPLDGYVLTYPKPTADTSLWVGEDPIASTWRLGLGAVTVLNTDLAGLGSAGWSAWAGLSELFGAILATTEPYQMSTIGLTASIARSADMTELLVDARNGGAFADFLDLEAELLPGAAAYELRQVGPGLYAASFATPPEGGYALHVIDRTRDRSLTLPLTVPYPDEVRQFGQDSATLARVAGATGGVLLEDEARLPTVSGATSTEYVPLHAPLLLAALAVFLIDLVARKRPTRASRAK